MPGVTINGHVIEDVAQVAYEAIAQVSSLYDGDDQPIWDTLTDDEQKSYVADVAYILDHPAASEKDWHDDWRRRRVDVVRDANLFREYEMLAPARRLQIRLWRHVVHAFIG